MTTASLSPEAKATLNMTAQTIGKDILAAVVQEMKLMPDVWQKLSEGKQHDVIERLASRVDHNVKMAVYLIASDGRIVVAGDLEQITIKDGVKAVVKFGSNAPNLHHLYESSSKSVLVVVANPSDHTVGMDEVQPDPDQPSFDMHDGDKTFAHTAEVVDDEIVALPFSPSFANDKTTSDDGEIIEVDFSESDWYKELCRIASSYEEDIELKDDDLWFYHSIDKTPQEAFFEVYPDHKPADEADDDHDGSTND